MVKHGSFRAGGTLNAKEEIYVKRQADVDLLSAVRSGKYAFVFTSRQMGKSSLMTAVHSELLDEKIAAVVLDLSTTPEEAVDWDATRWFAWFSSLLVFEMEGQRELEPGAIDVKRLFDEHASLGGATALTALLEEILRNQLTRSVVLFCDEIDSVLALPYSGDFFRSVRVWSNQRGQRGKEVFQRLTVVLLGVASSHELIRGRSRTPFNIAPEKIELRDFSHEEALEFARRLPVEEREHDRVIEGVLKWTSGHPYLTHRVCLELAVSGAFDDATINRVVEHLFFSDRDNPSDDNIKLTQERLLDGRRDKRKMLLLYDAILADGNVRKSAQNATQDRLQLAGVIRVDSDGLLRPRNLIYEQFFDRDWVQEWIPARYSRAERIAQWIALTAIALVAAVILLVIFLGEDPNFAEPGFWRGFEAQGASLFAEPGRMEDGLWPELTYSEQAPSPRVFWARSLEWLAASDAIYLRSSDSELARRKLALWRCSAGGVEPLESGLTVTADGGLRLDLATIARSLLASGVSVSTDRLDFRLQFRRQGSVASSRIDAAYVHDFALRFVPGDLELRSATLHAPMGDDIAAIDKSVGPGDGPAPGVRIAGSPDAQPRFMLQMSQSNEELDGGVTAQLAGGGDPVQLRESPESPGTFVLANAWSRLGLASGIGTETGQRVEVLFAARSKNGSVVAFRPLEVVIDSGAGVQFDPAPVQRLAGGVGRIALVGPEISRLETGPDSVGLEVRLRVGDRMFEPVWRRDASELTADVAFRDELEDQPAFELVLEARELDVLGRSDWRPLAKRRLERGAPPDVSPSALDSYVAFELLGRSRQRALRDGTGRLVVYSDSVPSELVLVQREATPRVPAIDWQRTVWRLEESGSELGRGDSLDLARRAGGYELRLVVELASLWGARAPVGITVLYDVNLPRPRGLRLNGVSLLQNQPAEVAVENERELVCEIEWSKFAERCAVELLDDSGESVARGEARPESAETESRFSLEGRSRILPGIYRVAMQLSDRFGNEWRATPAMARVLVKKPRIEPLADRTDGDVYVLPAESGSDGFRLRVSDPSGLSRLRVSLENVAKEFTTTLDTNRLGLLLETGNRDEHLTLVPEKWVAPRGAVGRPYITELLVRVPVPLQSEPARVVVAAADGDGDSRLETRSYDVLRDAPTEAPVISPITLLGIEWLHVDGGDFYVSKTEIPRSWPLSNAVLELVGPDAVPDSPRRLLAPSRRQLVPQPGEPLTGVEIGQMDRFARALGGRLPTYDEWRLLVDPGDGIRTTVKHEYQRGSSVFPLDEAILSREFAQLDRLRAAAQVTDERPRFVAVDRLLDLESAARDFTALRSWIGPDRSLVSALHLLGNAAEVVTRGTGARRTFARIGGSAYDSIATCLSLAPQDRRSVDREFDLGFRIVFEPGDGGPLARLLAEKRRDPK